MRLVEPPEVKTTEIIKIKTPIAQGLMESMAAVAITVNIVGSCASIPIIILHLPAGRQVFIFAFFNPDFREVADVLGPVFYLWPILKNYAVARGNLRVRRRNVSLKIFQFTLADCIPFCFIYENLDLRFS